MWPLWPGGHIDDDAIGAGGFRTDAIKGVYCTLGLSSTTLELDDISSSFFDDGDANEASPKFLAPYEPVSRRKGGLLRVCRDDHVPTFGVWRCASSA
jgi:hypothetical protein